MKRILLNGSCRLTFFDEDARQHNRPSPETTIAAAIPGNVEIDLMNVGILPDIYQKNNIKLLRPYEYYAWKYEIPITIPALSAGESAYLCFDGVDCIADYALNGVVFAHSENALIRHRFPLPDNAVTGENILTVLIHSPLLWAEKQHYDAYEWAYHCNFEALHIRKAPSQYGWDIMPRLVSAGIWRDVSLEIEGENEITEVYLTTKNAGSDAQIICAYNAKSNVPHLEGLTLRIHGSLNGEEKFVYDHTMRFICGRFHFPIHGAALWFPRGYGDANVYDITLELVHDGKVLCDYHTTLGIRTVRLIRTEICDEYGGDFHFEVNGQKIFCRGSNWVPADALHSRDVDRYEKMLSLFADTNCNMLRCWGGNVYEGDRFFDLCDRMGIMVWQDFAMACAYYPQNDAFAAVLRTEAEDVVKRLRNHPSLVLWSGDNECDGHMWALSQYNPDKNILTREVLPSVIHRLDPNRDYLPSSPYGSMNVIEKSFTLKKTPYNQTWRPSEPYKPILPEDHPWGSRDYYKSSYYKNLHCAFISEIGYHGCNDRESMATFLSPEKMWPWQNNDEWLTHASEMYGEKGPYAYRIGLMARQIYELFGVHPDNPDDFIFASQVSQAEADKYFIESSRQLKWARSGIIWWNMIDGWPQFSDAVVSYEGNKKLAYHYIKNAQHTVGLSFDEPRDWSIRLYASNDSLSGAAIHYRVTDGDSGETLLEANANIPANTTVGIAGLRLSWAEQRLLLIEWEMNGKRYTNHYIHGSPAFDLDRMKQWVRKIADFTADTDMTTTVNRILRKSF